MKDLDFSPWAEIPKTVCRYSPFFYSRTSIDLNARKGAYEETHCWQYDIRLKNQDEDLKAAGLTKDEASLLRVDDFSFEFVPKTDRAKCDEIRRFIERHEWLGKMPKRPTHRFTASYQGQLAGVVIMATPNSFSNLLGREKRHFEKLISRGACISWSPKNLASALIMFAIRWMAKNTEFRFFTAYSDVEARELGTIYQACNFVYLGQDSGAREEYFDPENPDRGWFSDRQFRKTNQIKKYAKALGIGWLPRWSGRDKVYWDEVPNEVQTQIKDYTDAHRARCVRRSLTKKHKYVCFHGRTKTETKGLRRLFEQLHPELAGLKYPKLRGPQAIDTAANFQKSKDTLLTQSSQTCRPAANESPYLTVKEAATWLRVSQWTIYNFIKADPEFPYLNIGMKKKFVVPKAGLDSWIEKRAKDLLLENRNIPTGQMLLEAKGG